MLLFISILYIVFIIFILDSALGQNSSETDSAGEFSLNPRSHYMFLNILKHFKKQF